jgi:hypothetical protein
MAFGRACGERVGHSLDATGAIPLVYCGKLAFPTPPELLTRQGAARPIATRTILLELTEEEAAALDTLLSRWPSRRLAATTGRSRNTLRCWFSRTRYQLRQNLPEKDRPAVGQSSQSPH